MSWFPRVTDAYNRLISDINLVKAMIGDETAQMMISFTDVLFISAFKQEVERRKDPNYLREQALKSVKSNFIIARKNREEIESLIDIYIDNYSRRINEMYRSIRDFTFMFDLYPEEKERFDFPENITD